MWARGRRTARPVAKGRFPVGTTFSFGLNEPARVSLAFIQRRRGRKVRGKCVRPARHRHKQASCEQAVTRGTLSFTGQPGRNRVSFRGRTSRSNTLDPGSYTVIITATNAASQRSKPRKLSFTVVK